MSSNPDLSQYASLIASIRWSRLDPEQRREATRKATEASLRARAAKTVQRESDGADENG